VVTPALEPVEQISAAVRAAPPAIPVRTEARPEPARLDPESVFANRALLARRASRATRPAAATRATRPAAATRGTIATRRAIRAASRGVREKVAPASRRTTARQDAGRVRTTRSLRARTARHPIVRVVTRQAAVKRVMRLGDMTAVVAYARSQIGARYVSGGEGPGGFDCSGFTKTAYARIGVRLPHSSGAQAARARRISRSQARPGDLVVGRGHVGIYMGHGMMIDAGNHRTGVVYRKLYSGLQVERL
jgi:peptidoglycan DL-endopeptidase CwlO